MRRKVQASWEQRFESSRPFPLNRKEASLPFGKKPAATDQHLTSRCFPQRTNSRDLFHRLAPSKIQCPDDCSHRSGGAVVRGREASSPSTCASLAPKISPTLLLSPLPSANKAQSRQAQAQKHTMVNVIMAGIGRKSNTATNAIAARTSKLGMTAVTIRFERYSTRICHWLVALGLVEQASSTLHASKSQR